MELLKQYHGYANAADQPAIYELGRIAVTFFFVLSGFLITYLLLVEKQNGSVAIGRFYLRRVLRIWPLYYLTIALAFFVLPHVASLAIPRLSALLIENRTATLALFLGFLPQVALSLYPPVPYGEPLWSIGVEEQFYLVWPLLIGRVRTILPVMLFIAVAGIAVKQGALLYASSLHDPAQLPFWNHFIDYFYFSRFECMAIGGLAAWLLLEQKEGVLRFLYCLPVQWVAYALAAVAIVTTRGKPILQYAPHAVIFAVIILNIAANPRSIVGLRHPAFTFLGNISYAMYLLHEIAIAVVMRVQIAATGTRFETIGANAVLYAASVLATVILSAATYRFYELRFLRLKSRFTVIASGPDLSAATA